MKRNKNIYYIIGVMASCLMASCVDDDSFSSSPSNLLSFSTDTVKLDTTFSKVPTVTKTMWVYNRSGDGIRCSAVRLEQGNQTGFRVNVDGTYLSPASGFKAQDVEIRKGDSIRVFVELTSAEQAADTPQLVADNLVFVLESGVQQKVNLKAYSWNAQLLRDVNVATDETWPRAEWGEKPIVIYGGLTVAENATLTLQAGAKLYFHENAGLDVHGTLKSQGTADREVVLRGDRIDHMFDYLPYDRTPGQWQGIRLRATSHDNHLCHTDVHSAYDGVVVDSCRNEAISRLSKLYLDCSTIHNCQGYGLKVDSAAIVAIDNSQLSNCLGNCLYVEGARSVKVNNTTFAQFYPFDGNRGSAIGFKAPVTDTLLVSNSLVTGYADDEIRWTPVEGEPLRFGFDHSVLRTEKMQTSDSLRFTHVLYEQDAPDTLMVGEKHFTKFDTDNLIYDFHLAEKSAAIGWACPVQPSDEGQPAADEKCVRSLPTDRNGYQRDGRKPDAGCYQHREKVKDDEKETEK